MSLAEFGNFEGIAYQIIDDNLITFQILKLLEKMQEMI